MGVNRKMLYPRCAFEQLELQQIQSRHEVMFLFLIGHESIIQVTGDVHYLSVLPNHYHCISILATKRSRIAFLMCFIFI